jgi:hypothetical protein
MADNFNATEGAGKIIATDEIAGVNFQRIKLTLGADGVNDGDVNSANPMPTSVSSSALPTGASTEATQALVKAKTDNLDVLLSTRATTALQTTGNSSLSSIDTKLSSQATASNQSTMITALNSIVTNTGAQSVDTLQTGTITALNGTVAINAQGAYTVLAQLFGTWVATPIFEGLLPDGTTWIQLPAFQVSTTLVPYNQLFSTTSNGTFLITGGGYTQVRVRASLFTSGTISVALNASLAQQTISTAQLGTWSVSNSLVDSTKASYSASALFTPVATASDIFYISGSATKTIRIASIQIQATQTTASYRDILLIKRSTANSGGTSTAPTKISHDSTDVASTVGSLLAYTANPTVGTPVGTIISRKLFISTTSLGGGELNLDFTGSLTKAVVLRGTAEGLAINLNAVTSAGNLFAITIHWTEE